MSKGAAKAKERIRKARRGAIIAFSLAGMIVATESQAQSISLPDYLASMDKTKVHFEGRIKYDSSDDNFTFFNEQQEGFGVTIDAGRETREKVQAKCDNPSFMVSYSDLCTISGNGTVEVRGSTIRISIEGITKLNGASGADIFSNSSQDSDASIEPISSGNGSSGKSESDVIFDQFKPCWNAGALSKEALRVETTLLFSFSGHEIDISSIKPKNIIATQAERAAYDAAKRAVLRCGLNGFSDPQGRDSGTANVTFKW